MGQNSRMKCWLALAVLVFLTACSEQQLARLASDWCRTNPDCDHGGVIDDPAYQEVR